MLRLECYTASNSPMETDVIHLLLVLILAALLLAIIGV